MFLDILQHRVVSERTGHIAGDAFQCIKDGFINVCAIKDRLLYEERLGVSLKFPQSLIVQRGRIGDEHHIVVLLHFTNKKVLVCNLEADVHRQWLVKAATVEVYLTVVSPVGQIVTDILQVTLGNRTQSTKSDLISHASIWSISCRTFLSFLKSQAGFTDGFSICAKKALSSSR